MLLYIAGGEMTLASGVMCGIVSADMIYANKGLPNFLVLGMQWQEY